MLTLTDGEARQLAGITVLDEGATLILAGARRAIERLKRLLVSGKAE